jgi:HK97 family phage major capsid protein
MTPEQIKKWKARQEEIRARLAVLLAVLAGTDAEAPRGLNDGEATEVAGLEQELERNERDIKSAERMIARETAAAAASAEPAAPRGVSRAPAVLTRTNQAQRDGDKFKGQTYMAYIRARTLMVVNSAVGDIGQMAASLYRDRPEYVDLFRKWAANEVPGGAEKSGEWGAELVAMDGRFTGDFIDYLRAKTVFDQLGLRQIPANVTVKGQDGTGAAFWVGEGKAVPMSKADFSTVNLQPLKIGALSAISLELIRDSSPSAMQLVQDSLTRDSSQLIDSTFFSATAASAGVSPAGIVNGVGGTGSSGSDLNGFITDMDVLVQAFITAKNTGGLKWASRPGLAQKIAGFTNLMGTKVYPSLSEEGGTLENKPFLTSDNVVSGDFLLIKPEDIYKIGDDGLSIDVSREATLEFASDPTGAALGTPVSASKQIVNLFQNGMVGIRLLRSINWAKRRSSAVARITSAAYVPQIQTA